MPIQMWVPVRLMSQMIKSSFSRRKFFGEKVVINGWAVPLELINWMDFLVMYFLYIINMVLINLIHSGFINTWISDQSNAVSTSCKTVDLKIILPSQLLNIENGNLIFKYLTTSHIWLLELEQTVRCEYILEYILL